MGGRAQTFTLEAFVAAILLLATIAFALQVVSISANTASPADAELRNQHAGLARGVMDEAATDGNLSRMLRYWDQNASAFHGADEGAADGSYYVSRLPQNADAPEFGRALGEPFDNRQVRYNVDLYYTRANGTRGHQQLVDSGTPSDDAVRVVGTVTLYDDTPLLDANGSRENTTLREVAADSNQAFYAPDARPDGPLYNVVRVEVVLWKP
ncbi:hypothetical protein HWV23_15625 [Natronomonas halophila]|uniref:DUF7288 family protein n=1 Tax=Natronomonas halophila TaxID=2747817 RepID=UPI0015B6D3E3|nr:hypothetical protein [Natronomonas halophila]QLD87091.1 hypothetical protein HWV23_15625 [Natronomonas halophila]